MAFNQVNYTHTEEEFEEMRRLLTQSYLENRKPHNWRLALAENWNMASRFLEPKEYFTSRVQLWRKEEGELAGFVIRGNLLFHPQVQYPYWYLVDEMLEWAEANWADGKAQVNAMAYDWDDKRQDLLIRRGYQKVRAIEEVRIYDLGKDYPEPALPHGYQIRSIAEVGDPQARVDLENSIWDAELDEAWYNGKSSAPSYSPDWDLVVVSPEGQLAAASLVWLYPVNLSAEIDPLGTRPDFRRRGLARAIVLESFKRMRACGMRYAYIASDSQNHIVNQLYASLQPVETYQGFLWSKQL